MSKKEDVDVVRRPQRLAEFKPATPSGTLATPVESPLKSVYSAPATPHSPPEPAKPPRAPEGNLPVRSANGWFSVPRWYSSKGLVVGLPTAQSNLGDNIVVHGWYTIYLKVTGECLECYFDRLEHAEAALDWLAGGLPNMGAVVAAKDAMTTFARARSCPRGKTLSEFCFAIKDI